MVLNPCSMDRERFTFPNVPAQLIPGADTQKGASSCLPLRLAQRGAAQNQTQKVLPQSGVILGPSHPPDFVTDQPSYRPPQSPPPPPSPKAMARPQLVCAATQEE